ncbi:hypothetical protein F5883DRAFT_644107 [Diaporthe sp. PMI_573]|nr:hypothetical protein F5883DRAFT_644107 [Diaporthaceae sp. PMI_573]
MWTNINVIALVRIALPAAWALAFLPSSPNIATQNRLGELHPNNIRDGDTPKGRGPRPGEDTPHAFRSFKPFHDASNSAQSPRGYELAAQDLNRSVESDLGFLGTHLLGQYNPDECSRLCDDLPTCAFFYLYFEQEPLRGRSHNFGELREGFEVVITGSNLYNKMNRTLDLGHIGFSGPWLGVDNDAAFEVPNEPEGNYSTILMQKLLYYSSYDSSATLDHCDPTICASLCSNITDQAEPSYPFTNSLFPVCSMFVAYELRYNVPLAMVCELYSSVWSSRYQTLRKVAAFSGQGKESVTLRPTKVSVYHRRDYKYPPICAMEYQCGKDFYAGGDCSGWGKGFC